MPIQKDVREQSHAIRGEIEKDERPVPFIKSAASFIWEIAKVVVVALAIVFVVRYFLIQPFYVKGASMEPTFHDYEYLIINEISYRFHQPARGEIIVFRYSRDPSQFFIKRVIGLPNETVEIKNEMVIIHNQEHPQGIVLDESSYLGPEVVTRDNLSVTVGPDQFFVMGDNRSASLDSRRFGPISRHDIIGSAWLRAWPFYRFTYFRAPHYNF